MYKVVEHQHINVDLVFAGDGQDLIGFGGKDSRYAIMIPEAAFKVIKDRCTNIGRSKVADQEGFMWPPAQSPGVEL